MADRLTGSAETSALLRARKAVIWIETIEGARVDRACHEIAATWKATGRSWDCVGGITDANGAKVESINGPPRRDSAGGIAGKGQRIALQNTQDVDAALTAVADSGDHEVWIFHDLAPWLKNPVTCRTLKNLAMRLSRGPVSEARAIIVLADASEPVPPSLADSVVVVKWKLPTREEIGMILDQSLRGAPDQTPLLNGAREAAIEAAVGLSAEGASTCFKKCIVVEKKIVPAVIADQKKLVVSGKGIEWYDPDPRGLEAVAGLDNLKPWLMLRRTAYSAAAQAFGLPKPKGLFLVGVQGCGKSLTAKATATAWACPLLKIDLGGMLSKYVGESQSNLRNTLDVIDAIGRCVVWFDEIEKALAGSSGAQGDGGVATDALGVLLTWMQERKGQSFIIATANDVSALPPELLRKGRFDEIFFVDLPTAREREAILRVSIAKYPPPSIGQIDVAAVAAASELFSGAEVAEIVAMGLFDAFADGARPLATGDLIRAAGATVPLAKMAAEKVQKLRDWAAGRARPASSPELVADISADFTTELDLTSSN